jgi:hypothetical protein
MPTDPPYQQEPAMIAPKNSIWYVETEGGTLTVIATSAAEATAIVLDAGTCRPLGLPLLSTDWPPEHWRAVVFDNHEDLESQIRQLEEAGVDLARVRQRYSETALGGAPLWEVVARDIDWCRLPARVL